VSPDRFLGLRALAEALPEGSAVPVPKAWLLELLDAGRLDPAQAPAAADLTVAQVAARFGRNPSTVRGWIERGFIPGAYRFQAREWRVPAASLEAFEANQRTAGSPRSAGTTRGQRGTVDLGAWRTAS
jgi:Helix-turn-helix domain